MPITKHDSFHVAVHTIMVAQDCPDHVYEVRALTDEQAKQVIEEELPDEVDALLASTLAEWMMAPDTVAIYSVDHEMHLGYVIAHYNGAGEIVRFFSVL